jgi:hypothetical protein
MGFWNDATQEAILNTTVAIGGAGGAGFLAGLELQRIGVQNFVIADPEDFDDVNGNRVLGVNVGTVGRNKADVFEETILASNPEANVRKYKEGINAENVAEFMHGADIVLDATELSMPELGTMICRAARVQKTPVVNVEYVAHAGQGTVFHPESRMTFERFMGIKGGEKAPLDEVAQQKINPNRYLAYIPKYADLSTLEALDDPTTPLPSNMIGAGQAAQIGVSEMLKLIRERVGERGLKPTYAPHVRWMDAYSGVSGHSRFPRTTFYRHLGVAVARNLAHLNEPAAYRKDERAARGDIS